MTGENRIGVMGGTFDPIHLGHLAIAEEARYRLGLERLLFVPCGVPPHKKPYEISAPQHRYTMIQRAIRDNPHFMISSIELEREGVSYTVDTVAALQQQFPAAHIYFITGADAILEILTWKDPERLAASCVLVAATRPGYDLEAFRQRVGEDLASHVHMLAAPGVDVSSSEIRRRCAEGAPIRYLVPKVVIEYIEHTGLYGCSRR